MFKAKYLNVSNLLSFSRMLLVIPIWYFMDHFPDQTFRYLVAAAGIFAAITDVLDGYFARKLNEVTEIGKIIDPLADKILVGFVIIRLFLLGEIPTYYFSIIVGRDLLILLGGLWIASRKKIVPPSDYLGKATVLSISFVMLMILLNVDKDAVYFIILFYLSIALIIISLANYSFKAVRAFTKK